MSQVLKLSHMEGSAVPNMMETLSRIFANHQKNEKFPVHFQSLPHHGRNWASAVELFSHNIPYYPLTHDCGHQSVEEDQGSSVRHW